MPFAWSPAAAEAFRAGDTEALLWTPAPALIVTCLKGHASVELLAFYTARAEREMARGRLTVFHDWAGLTTYDPAVRDELRRWGKLHNDRFERVEYLVRSKVVGMLISVAALTLGRELHATADRPTFLADLERALATRQPRGA